MVEKTRLPEHLHTMHIYISLFSRTTSHPMFWPMLLAAITLLVFFVYKEYEKEKKEEEKEKWKVHYQQQQDELIRNISENISPQRIYIKYNANYSIHQDRLTYIATQLHNVLTSGGVEIEPFSAILESGMKLSRPSEYPEQFRFDYILQVWLSFDNRFEQHRFHLGMTIIRRSDNKRILPETKREFYDSRDVVIEIANLYCFVFSRKQSD